MGFGQAHVARTAQAKPSNPLRNSVFNARSLLIQQGPICLAVPLSSRLQGLILGIRSQLNAPTFHARTLGTNGAGPARLARELDKHAGLVIFSRIKPAGRRMSWRASGVLMAPIHLEIRRGIALSR